MGFLSPLALSVLLIATVSAVKVHHGLTLIQTTNEEPTLPQPPKGGKITYTPTSD